MRNLFLVIILFHNLLSAQDRTSANVNNIFLPFNNSGHLAFVKFDSYRSLGTYPGPKGKGFLFDGGFLLSGYSDTTLWANGATYMLEDYQPGLVGSDPLDRLNSIYVVKKSDKPFGESWQLWEHAVEQGAYYYDGDENGVYKPIDHNNDGNWDLFEDRPDILYDVNYFCVYNDGVPSSQRFSEFKKVSPLGIEIRQSIFASNKDMLKDVLFIRYSIIYKGTRSANEPDLLSEVFFSIWTDTDIGGTASAASDDLVGCDTTLNAGYSYNDGADEDWGTKPPAVFKVFVQGPLIKSVDPKFKGYNKRGPLLGEKILPGYKNLGMTTFAPPHKNDRDLHDPNSPQMVRTYAEALYPDWNEIDPCNFVYGRVEGGVDCSSINNKFWFSGDPVAKYGWLDYGPEDMRDMTSTGPFTLHKNEAVEIIVAYVVGQGADALNSITQAREITKYVHEEYQRNFITNFFENENPEEKPSEFSLSQNYPNPFNPTTTINFSIPNVGTSRDLSLQTKLIVYDVLGRVVKTLVNEVKAPGSYEVNFDASQLSSGVYFYKLQSGSFIQTKKMMVIK